MSGLHSIMPRKPLSVVLSITLLIVAFWVAGANDVLTDLRNFPLWAVLSVLGLFSLNLVVVSFRLGRILSHFKITLPARVVSTASVAGHVAGLFVMSLFGQTVGRHLVLRNYGVSSVMVASLMAYERSIILVVSGSLCLVGAIVLLDEIVIRKFISDLSLIEIFFVIVVSIILSLWLRGSKFEAQIISRTKTIKSISKLLNISIITLIGQLLVLSAFVIGVLTFRPDVDIWRLLAASAIISFAASMPVTLNGWGVRELAAVYILGHLGVSSSNALAVSVLVGLCSTAVILAFSPMAFRKQEDKTDKDIKESNIRSNNDFSLEKTAAWMLSISVAVLVFFQIHVPLPGGVINLNLADPFAILSLASVVVHMIATRTMPSWKIKRFNLALLAISLLLIFGFFVGSIEIGVTQWALASRLTGWFVILGYVGAGYIIVSYMGRRGLRRFSETMAITAVVIVIVRMMLRYLDSGGWLELENIAKNFEGYAGNRNAFAFQMLTCSVLVLAYSSIYIKVDKQLLSLRENSDISLSLNYILSLLKINSHLILISLSHGVILAGIVFSASRAGLITAMILLISVFLMKLTDRRMIVLSITFALLIWIIPLIGLGDSLLQSSFSKESSNIERWETISRGFAMWLDSPIFGAGLGVFIERSTEWLSRPLVIHSTPVWILTEFGLLGVILFVWVLWVFARFLISSGLTMPAHKILIMLLYIFLIFGLVHEIFYQRIFWLVLGAALAFPGHMNVMIKKS